MKFLFFTINSFSGLPLIRYIIKRDNAYITMCHCVVDGLSDYKGKVDKQLSLKFFKSHKEYNNKSLFLKIERYFKAIFFLAFYLIAERKNKQSLIFYSTDFFSLYLGLLVKKFFLRKRGIIIYHQFELFDPVSAPSIENLFYSKAKKLFTYLDLVIQPEINRMDFFKDISQLDKKVQSLIIPNTKSHELSANNLIERRLKNNKIVIGHIGAVGYNHYIKEFTQVMMSLSSEKFEFWFVGNLQDKVKAQINALGLKNIKLFGQVPHDNLEKIYFQIDIGIILYKDVSLNFRYCAPNKLYEYWSYGIPVVAHSLPSLVPLFTTTCQGNLVNMSNEVDFVEKIENIATNFDLTEKKALIQHFKTNYDISIYMNKLNDTINQLTC